MLRIFIVPIIFLLMIKNCLMWAALSDAIDSRFMEDYHTVICAREEVYRRNLDDAFRYLSARFAYVGEKTFAVDEFVSNPTEGCDPAAFRVYREINPKLPSLYPNWIYRERSGGD